MLNHDDTAGGHGFTTAAVVGAGLMGARLAGVLAAGGLEVRLTDVRTGRLDEATEVAAEVARTRAADAQQSAGGVVAEKDLRGALDGVDLVIEAISENLADKQDLFARMESLAPAAVLATNTSVLPVGLVTERVRDTTRVIGTHWWNPPDLIPVVEVVLTPHTGSGTTDRVVRLLSYLGKLPVLVHHDVPGFIGNRLQHALWREAIALVEEGVADAATVDLVVRNTIGLRLARMGPIENADYVGLDLTLAIHEAVLPGLNRSSRPSPRLSALVDAGQLGAKSGRGFLDWPPGARERASRELALHVAAQLNAATTSRRRESS